MNLFFRLFCDIKNNREYIAVMYNKGKGQGYSQSQSKELQLWDWDGCLLKRIVFEHPFGSSSNFGGTEPK